MGKDSLSGFISACRRLARLALSSWVVVLAAALAGAAGFGMSALAAIPHANISGTWSASGNDGMAPQQWAITDSGGTLSGSASDGGAPFSPITGTDNNGNVTIVTAYTGGGYTATFTGTVSGGGTTMSGSWSDTNGISGATWTATLTSGTGTTTTGTTTTGTTTTTTTPPGRASSTEVLCTYTLADVTDVCTADVADASGQGGLPTGTVAFTSAPGSTFVAGSSCTLAETPDDVGITSCSVSYEGTSTQSLQVNATYSGDRTFAPSSGSTSFLVAGAGNDAYTPTIQAFNPPVLNATVDIPVPDSTVDANGAVTMDLTQQAPCLVADSDQPGDGTAVASAARASVKRHGPTSVGVMLVKHHVHKGKLRLKVHFSTRALRRAFPRGGRVQLVITVTITPPHGRSVTTFVRKIVVLRLRGLRAGTVRTAHAFAADAPAQSTHIYAGSNKCGTFTATVPALVKAPSITLSWTDVKGTCFAGNGGTSGTVINFPPVSGATLGTYGDTLTFSVHQVSPTYHLDLMGSLSAGSGTVLGGWTASGMTQDGDAFTCSASPPPLTQTQ
jgi:hypothetical protein